MCVLCLTVQPARRLHIFTNIFHLFFLIQGGGHLQECRGGGGFESECFFFTEYVDERAMLPVLLF